LKVVSLVEKSFKQQRARKKKLRMKTEMLCWWVFGHEFSLCGYKTLVCEIEFLLIFSVID